MILKGHPRRNLLLPPGDESVALEHFLRPFVPHHCEEFGHPATAGPMAKPTIPRLVLGAVPPLCSLHGAPLALRQFLRFLFQRFDPFVIAHAPGPNVRFRQVQIFAHAGGAVGVKIAVGLVPQAFVFGEQLWQAAADIVAASLARGASFFVTSNKPAHNRQKREIEYCEGLHDPKLRVTLTQENKARISAGSRRLTTENTWL